MNFRFATLFVVAIACASVVAALPPPLGYTRAALNDEIDHLPGLQELPSFKQFSGYIPVHDNERGIFYWLAESMNDPANDPVVLWTNGGPGCSGLTGFFTEHGPYRVNKDMQLEENPHAWNQVASIVFIEQPAGVGFSYNETEVVYGDLESALDNYDFVKGFFDRFPEFKDNDFYLTSESYGGHYLPTLAYQLVVQGGVPNFKGFAVGNPLTWMPYRNYGQYGTYAMHQLIDKPLWDKYEENNCKEDEGESDTCAAITNKMDQLTSGMDPYALDFPICTSADAVGQAERAAIAATVKRSNTNAAKKRMSLLQGYFPEKYEPCRDNYALQYLNLAAVQAAIHVRDAGKFKWTDCNMNVNMNYNATDTDAPMMPIYQFLIENGKKNPDQKLNILIYSGDDDSICATLGSQQFIWDLGYSVEKEWAPWKVDGQTAGFAVEFDGFSFVTVHGAGHMVPATRPAQALELFKRYLAGEEY